MTRFAQMSARLLARYGGVVELSRMVLQPAENPWDDPVETRVAVDVPFIAIEASDELVAANVIVAGDLVGIMAVPGLLAPPLMTDRITAGGRTYAILEIAPVDADPGGVIHYRVHGR